MRRLQRAAAVMLVMMPLVSGRMTFAQILQDSVPPEEAREDGRWRLGVGVVHQVGASMSFRGPSATLVRDAWSSLPGRNGRTLIDKTTGFHPSMGAIAAPSDNITRYANRTFDDGFVNLDTWTLDPLVPAARIGTTWNWGYVNLSQYDGGPLTLTFHRTSSVGSSGLAVDSMSYNEDRCTRTILLDRDVYGSDELAQDGLQFTAQRRLKHWEHWDLDLDLNIAWFPESTTRASDTPFEMIVRQDTFRVTDRQNSAYSYSATFRETYVYGDRFGRLDPLLPPLPVSAPPPYGGGGMNGPGPLIPNLPESYRVNTLAFSSVETPLGSDHSSVLVGSRSWDIADRVDMKVDVQRMRLAGGLALIRPLTERLEVAIDPKLTLNIVELDATRAESVMATDQGTGLSSVIASSLDRRRKLFLMPGIMLALDANYHLTERWFVGVDASYELLLDTLNVRMGQDTVRVNLDGLEFSLHLGRNF